MKILSPFIFILFALTAFGQTELIRPIVEGSDDAEQVKIDIVLDNEVITIGVKSNENHIAGFRYQDMTLPKGAEINSAYIQFSAASDNLSNTLLIRGQKSANPEPFEDLPNNISSRPKTDNDVTWQTGAWEENGQGVKQQTPNLSAIIQEIIDQEDWSSGNAIVFVVSEVGTSSFKPTEVDAFEELGEVLSPTLVIYYTIPDGVFTKKVDVKMSILPNPVEDIFTISFDQPGSAKCKISLLDIIGNEVAIIYDAVLDKGPQNFVLSAKTEMLHQGLYFVTYRSEEGIATKKLIIN